VLSGCSVQFPGSNEGQKESGKQAVQLIVGKPSFMSFDELDDISSDINKE